MERESNESLGRAAVSEYGDGCAWVSIVPKAWKMEHARHRYHHPANAGTNRDNAHCPSRQSRPFFLLLISYLYSPRSTAETTNPS